VRLKKELKRQILLEMKSQKNIHESLNLSKRNIDNYIRNFEEKIALMTPFLNYLIESMNKFQKFKKLDPERFDTNESIFRFVKQLGNNVYNATNVLDSEDKEEDYLNKYFYGQRTDTSHNLKGLFDSITDFIISTAISREEVSDFDNNNLNIVVFMMNFYDFLWRQKTQLKFYYGSDVRGRGLERFLTNLFEDLFRIFFESFEKDKVMKSIEKFMYKHLFQTKQEDYDYEYVRFPRGTELIPRTIEAFEEKNIYHLFDNLDSFCAYMNALWREIKGLDEKELEGEVDYIVGEYKSIINLGLEKDAYPLDDFLTDIKESKNNFKYFCKKIKQICRKNIKLFRSLEEVERKYNSSEGNEKYQEEMSDFFNRSKVMLFRIKIKKYFLKEAYKNLTDEEREIISPATYDFEYNTSTGNNVQIRAFFRNKEKTKKGIESIELFYRLMKDRGITDHALSLIKTIRLTDVSEKHPTGGFTGGHYIGFGQSRNLISIDVNNELSYLVRVLVHEFGHLIHHNSHRAAQGFWRDFLQGEVGEEHVPEEMYGWGQKEKFKDVSILPTDYASENLLEAFAEIFERYIIDPKSLHSEAIYAVRRYLSLSNFYNEGLKTRIHENKKILQKDQHQ